MFHKRTVVWGSRGCFIPIQTKFTMRICTREIVYLANNFVSVGWGQSPALWPLWKCTNKLSSIGCLWQATVRFFPGWSIGWEICGIAFFVPNPCSEFWSPNSDALTSSKMLTLVTGHMKPKWPHTFVAKCEKSAKLIWASKNSTRIWNSCYRISQKETALHEEIGVVDRISRLLLVRYRELLIVDG